MNPTNRCIVVGYDGSADADLALMWAARTSSLMSAPVKTVVVEERYPGTEAASGAGTAGEMGEHVQRMLEKAGAEGTLERHPGPIVPALVAAARDASMLVVGSHGHGRAAEALLGSVSQHVARHASCPVVVVREPALPSASRIVVGVDGSGGSAAALEFACRRAELTGEIVVALHAWKVGQPNLDRQAQLPAGMIRSLEDHELLLSESVAGVRSDHPDVTLLEEAIPVAPGKVLVDASADASLVVTGSRGRGAFAGMLLGSVSHEVLYRARCPVAVVR